MRIWRKKRGGQSAERAYIAMLRGREAERAMVQWFYQWQCGRLGKGVIEYV